MNDLIKCNPSLITFDVYSALVDIYAGLTPVFQDIANIPYKKSLSISKAWRSKQMETLQLSNSLNNGRISFYECTEKSLEYICKVNNLHLDKNEKIKLISAWNNLPLWPEAQSVIYQLINDNYKIAILSNGDQEMLEKLSTSFNFDFDNILSTETNGYYKPHPSVYELPKKVLGIDKKNTLHIAGGLGDVVGSKSFGLPCYWSNRNKDILIDQKYSPDYEFQDLHSIIKILI